MPAIAVQPFLMTNCTVGIGTDTYEAACTSVLFTPTTNVVKFKGLTPTSRHRFAVDPEWVAAITFAQDWASAASLSKRLLNATVGEEVSLTFAPIAGGPDITATIMLVPTTIGGDIDTVPTSAVQFEVVGSPELATV